MESRLDNILAEGASEGGIGEEGLQAKKPLVATPPLPAGKSEGSMLLIFLILYAIADESLL